MVPSEPGICTEVVDLPVLTCLSALLRDQTFPGGFWLWRVVTQDELWQFWHRTTSQCRWNPEGSYLCFPTLYCLFKFFYKMLSSTEFKQEEDPSENIWISLRQVNKIVMEADGQRGDGPQVLVSESGVRRDKKASQMAMKMNRNLQLTDMRRSEQLEDMS